MNHKLTVTVAIPTCYGGKSLVRVVESLRASSLPFTLIVRADSQPITPEIKKRLVELRTQLTENKNPGSQLHKAKQMIAETQSDIFVFTQDDVIFDPNALHEIVIAFETHPNVTMVAAHVIPKQATTIFEKIVEVGLHIVDHVATSWNKGDNYLAANGRCIAFRTNHLKKMKLPETLVNADAYLYFENERIGGSFLYAKNAQVYNPSPTKLSEQMRQTERFRFSQRELSTIFGAAIIGRYQIPKLLFLRALAIEAFISPVLFLSYIIVQVIAMVKFVLYPKDLTPYWKVNKSTKL